MKISSLISLIGVVGLVGTGLLLAPPREAVGPASGDAAQTSAATATLKTATLSVEGMTCASCTVTVRMSVKKLDGVKEATVQLDEKRARIQYDPAHVTPQQLADAVTRAGYGATVVSERKGT